MTELEILYAARSPAHRRELKSTLKEAYRWVVMPDRIYRRAERVQQTLTDRGTHRSAGAVDLLVAATAEEHGLTLLHYDTDFMQGAQVTGQPVRWLAEPGSIRDFEPAGQRSAAARAWRSLSASAGVPAGSSKLP